MASVTHAQAAPVTQAVPAVRIPVGPDTGVPMLAASGSHLVLTSAQLRAEPESATVQCAYYVALCMTGTDVTLIALAAGGVVLQAVGIAIQILALKKANPPDEGDVEIDIEDDIPGSEDYGDCLNAAGYPGTPYVEWYPQCGTAGAPDDEFVEVPTGGAIALMSEWYSQQEGELLYQTLYSIDPGNQPDGVWLFPSTYGNEDYRTWYFPSTPPPPNEVPAAPSPAPSATPSPPPSGAVTTAYVRRGPGWTLAA